MHGWIIHNNINNISVPSQAADFKWQKLTKTNQINPDTNVTRQILQITLAQTPKYTLSNSITQILNYSHKHTRFSTHSDGWWSWNRHNVLQNIYPPRLPFHYLKQKCPAPCWCRSRQITHTKVWIVNLATRVSEWWGEISHELCNRAYVLSMGSQQSPTASSDSPMPEQGQ